ncbi:MAG: TatD family hydrolase [Candidatus Lloydbacteria bacterium]|nr:TatD family hydrolase [Candidatus Lloydbacteria bacterium]
MPPKFFDIHTHAHFAAFDEDRDGVMERAREAGVAMINVGTDRDTSLAAILLAEKYEPVYATVGLHPIHTDKETYHDKSERSASAHETSKNAEVFDEAYYRTLASHEKVVAIGECGLDYFRLNEDTKQKQIEAFKAQIALANELGKPLMLHIRNAYQDAYDLLKQNAAVKGNVHFFAGTWDEAKLFLDLGLTLSFTGVITFARQYDDVIKNVPLDRLMSETDAPYVAPVPYRGRRNEPAYVIEVVKKIAEIRGEPYEKVREALAENAVRFFHL